MRSLIHPAENWATRSEKRFRVLLLLLAVLGRFSPGDERLRCVAEMGSETAASLRMAQLPPGHRRK